MEDSKADIFLIREAIASAKIEVDLQEVHDGQQAVQFIDTADRDPDAFCPELILLDLNLPKKTAPRCCVTSGPAMPAKTPACW